MKYKLFDDYITLQALLKEVGIIQSGGAIKSFLQENQVYFNGELETRRGKKIHIGDTITLQNQKIASCPSLTNFTSMAGFFSKKTNNKTIIYGSKQ